MKERKIDFDISAQAKFNHKYTTLLKMLPALEARCASKLGEKTVFKTMLKYGKFNSLCILNQRDYCYNPFPLVHT